MLKTNILLRRGEIWMLALEYGKVGTPLPYKTEHCCARCYAREGMTSNGRPSWDQVARTVTMMMTVEFYLNIGWSSSKHRMLHYLDVYAMVIIKNLAPPQFSLQPSNHRKTVCTLEEVSAFITKTYFHSQASGTLYEFCGTELSIIIQIGFVQRLLFSMLLIQSRRFEKVNILFWLRNTLLQNIFWKACKSRLKRKNKNKSSRRVVGYLTCSTLDLNLNL